MRDDPATGPESFPWREVLPDWPDARRERWGLRANALAEAGVPWPEDERQAFAEVSAEKAKPQPDQPRPAEPMRKRLKSSMVLFGEK